MSQSEEWHCPRERAEPSVTYVACGYYHVARVRRGRFGVGEPEDRALDWCKARDPDCRFGLRYRKGSPC
jgi:hypothetical protein